MIASSLFEEPGTLQNLPFCFTDFPPSLAMKIEALAHPVVVYTSHIFLCLWYRVFQQEVSDGASSLQSCALCI